jgi:hypothetical protein
MFDVRCSIFDARCSLPAGQAGILDAQYKDWNGNLAFALRPPACGKQAQALVTATQLRLTWLV